MQTKEIKFKPNIADGDFEVKVKKIKKFLEEGHRVKISMFFRGRENAHKEIGLEKVKKAMESVQDVSSVNSPLKSKGNSITVILSAKKK